jgi:hypothetical protein
MSKQSALPRRSAASKESLRALFPGLFGEKVEKEVQYVTVEAWDIKPYVCRSPDGKAVKVLRSERKRFVKEGEMQGVNQQTKTTRVVSKEFAEKHGLKVIG